MKGFLRRFYPHLNKANIHYLVFLLLFIGLLAVSCNISSSSKTYKLEELSYFDRLQFRGKEVEFFLNRIEEKYDKRFFLDEPPGYLYGCKFVYKEYIVIIVPSTYSYVEWYKPELDWDFEKFKKEKISKIKISKRM